MSKSPILVIVACAVLGAAGGYIYLQNQGGPSPTGADAHDHDGDGVPDHGDDAHAGESADGAASEHGVSVSVPADAAVCAEHHVPKVICPFCDPSLVEAHGFCGSHGVPEAYCTRCRPAVIAGFKATGDWCSDHGLPMSQCAEHGS